MRAYLDGGFLLVLLSRAPGTGIASSVLREIEPPVTINFIHQLQVENMLIRFQKDADPDLQVNGNEGFRLWNHYLEEGVFSLTSVDWEGALRNAITWNRLSPDAPPSPWLFLHPAIALSEGATHFCSFDPRPRSLARAHGLSLLPVTVQAVTRYAECSTAATPDLVLHSTEWGVGNQAQVPSVADQTNTFNGVSTALNARLFPRIRYAAYFDARRPNGTASAILPVAWGAYSNLANSPYLTQQDAHRKLFLA